MLIIIVVVVLILIGSSINISSSSINYKIVLILIVVVVVVMIIIKKSYFHTYLLSKLLVGDDFLGGKNASKHFVFNKFAAMQALCVDEMNGSRREPYGKYIMQLRDFEYIILILKARSAVVPVNRRTPLVVINDCVEVIAWIAATCQDQITTRFNIRIIWQHDIR